MFDEQENFAADFSSKITQLQAQELTHILEDCDFHYQELIMRSIKREFKADKIADIPAGEYERVKKAAVKYMEATHAKQLKEGVQ